MKELLKLVFMLAPSLYFAVTLLVYANYNLHRDKQRSLEQTALAFVLGDVALMYCAKAWKD